jgi:hypothetical protein
MPRVNWALSDETKAIFDAFKKDNGFTNQDDAANALLKQFKAYQERDESPAITEADIKSAIYSKDGI